MKRNARTTRPPLCAVHLLTWIGFFRCGACIGLLLLPCFASMPTSHALVVGGQVSPHRGGGFQPTTRLQSSSFASPSEPNSKSDNSDHEEATPSEPGLTYNNNGPEESPSSQQEKNVRPYESNVKNYNGDASSLFGNIRIPAALFAGASAGAAFALPVVVTASSEGLKLGVVKRLYALLMMGALSSEIVAVVVSTLAVGKLATQPGPATNSVTDLLSHPTYALSWVAARWHFLSGLLLFVTGVGLRGWISIACPVISKAALGMVVSSVVLCMAFIQDDQSDRTSTSANVLDGLVTLPLRYMQLLTKKARSTPLFAIALAMTLTTFGYVVIQTPHVLRWLRTTNITM